MQTAKLGVNEPLACLGARLIVRRELATRDEHVAFKPSALQALEYALSQNWLQQACFIRSAVQTKKHGGCPTLSYCARRC